MDTTDTVTVVETAEDRVARGYAWLTTTGQQEYGLDVSRVNPATIAMTNGYRCVLGQASGNRHYASVIDQIMPRRSADLLPGQFVAMITEQEAWARAYGFQPDGGEWPDYLGDVDALTAAWRARLVGV